MEIYPAYKLESTTTLHDDVCERLDDDVCVCLDGRTYIQPHQQQIMNINTSACDRFVLVCWKVDQPPFFVGNMSVVWLF
jgi:hypothetical protein